MPLITLSGYPASGTSSRAKELHEFLQARITQNTNPSVQRMTVHTISDQILGIPRSVYANPRREKNARSLVLSTVKRMLSRDRIVILDRMNYVKGFRYQLFCDAKAVGTTSCVIHVGTSASQSRSQNFNRNKLELLYSPEVFEELVARYEEPDGRHRWDSPLWLVLPDDNLEPILKALWESVIDSSDFGSPKNGVVANRLHSNLSVQPVKSHLSTIAPPIPPPNALQCLHSHTLIVVKELQNFLSAGKVLSKPTPIYIGGLPNPVVVPIKSTITPAYILRLQRQYIQIKRKGTLIMGGSALRSVQAQTDSSSDVGTSQSPNGDENEMASAGDVAGAAVGAGSGATPGSDGCATITLTTGTPPDSNPADPYRFIVGFIDYLNTEFRTYEFKDSGTL